MNPDTDCSALAPFVDLFSGQAHRQTMTIMFSWITINSPV